MKKIAITVLLAAAALTGCSPAQSAPAAPSPSTMETQILTNDLMAVSPPLANAHSVDAARNVCSAIVAGKDGTDLTNLTKTEFTSGEVKSVSDKQAAGIITAIRGNSFCPTKK